MDAIEKRARELLAEGVRSAWPDDHGRRLVIDALLVDGLDFISARVAVKVLAAALTPPEGHVVVIRNEAGQTVAVTRQDAEGRILSVVAEFEATKGDMGNPISVPDGYVLVPVEPTEAMKVAGSMWNTEMDEPPEFLALMNIWRDMLAARPEVK